MKRTYVKPEIVSELLEATAAACTCSGTVLGSLIADAISNFYGG